MDNDLIYKIALTQIPKVGSVTAKNLISYCGGVKEVFSKSKSFLKKVPGIGETLAANIYSFDGFEAVHEEIYFINQNKVDVHFLLDNSYPHRLKQIPDCPIVVYSKGSSNLNPEKCIAIVGTRKMTSYGKQFVHKLIEEISVYQPTIVSGLAYGVDVQAHKQSLKYDLPTFGVVAHGLDQVYPSLHRPIVQEMIKNKGAVISEYTSKTIPIKENFPMRNRLVAGMVDAVIVIESANKGGSLITAELANQYNRDVLALPGAINQKYSAGCNYLIKKNKAHLIEGVEDLVQLLNWDVQIEKKVQKPLFQDFTDNQQKLFSIIHENTEVGIDHLQSKSGFISSLLAITLLELEMKNCIVSLPGKRYKSLQ